jgi:hypothetical protein
MLQICDTPDRHANLTPSAIGQAPPTAEYLNVPLLERFLRSRQPLPQQRDPWVRVVGRPQPGDVVAFHDESACVVIGQEEQGWHPCVESVNPAVHPPASQRLGGNHQGGVRRTWRRIDESTCAVGRLRYMTAEELKEYYAAVDVSPGPEPRSPNDGVNDIRTNVEWRAAPSFARAP